MSKLLERFLNYVKIDTMSAEDVNQTPSTQKQFDLAKLLEGELKALRLDDIILNDKCILTATLKSNCNSNLTIGFIAHMDTIPGVSGSNVKPIVHKNYDGKVIELKNGIKLDPDNFPFMKELLDQTLITTDGTTVLGADDKAGVAIIMSMLEFYVTNPNQNHVNIKVAFTPDEEIGGGIESFNVEEFGCDYAYTIDGGMYNEINYENFNAASAVITIKGLDIHPGSAKGKMKNACLIAMEYQSLLPVFDNPMYTEGYEGFNHLMHMEGEVGEAKLVYILRNHDKNLLDLQKQDLENAVRFINTKYGLDTANISIRDSYKNMADIIKHDMRSVNRAKKAINDLGFTAVTTPIRGGTDGAKLTQNGLNTPNLGTGGYNCHGQYEFACLEEMQNVLEIIKLIAKER